jgi:chorismate-pyruvate lyase
LEPTTDPASWRLGPPDEAEAGHDIGAPPRPLTPLERVLVETDGTMTFLLEAVMGESIEAVKLHQELDTSEAAEQAVLGLADAAVVMRRHALLRGRHSRRVFVYAAAVVAIDRIDAGLADALRTTDTPIGRLLAENRTETFRDFLHRGRRRAGAAGRYLDLAAGDEVLFRTYRIHSGGEPIMLITERFSPQLLVTLGEVTPPASHPRPQPMATGGLACRRGAGSSVQPQPTS